MKDFTIIASLSKTTFGIGNNGQIPWNIDGDMEFFKRITSSSSTDKKNAVIMGRKTWESLPNKSRPLHKRVNVVISRDPLIKKKLSMPEPVFVVSSLYSALILLSENNEIDKIYVIGGEAIYREAIESYLCSRIYITEILNEVSEMDTFFPTIPLRYKRTELSDIIVENNFKYRFTQYDR